MPWPDDDIPELVKGERPTLLEAELGNEIIRSLNALRNITVNSGAVNNVLYYDDEVKIITKGGWGGESGMVRVLDAEDPTAQYRIRWNSLGLLEEIISEPSEWIEKEIVICEDGEEATYTFLVKSTDPP